MDIGRCLLREARIHRRYWPEIMTAVAYLKNRTIANTIENKTPYEIFFSRKPNVKHLKIYGSRVFARIPEVKRQSKWDDKAELGVLVGYTNNGYRVLINGKVKNVKHVTVFEESTKLICLEKIDDEKDRENYESASEIENDDDKNETNLLPSISTFESSRDNQRNLENVEYQHNENFEYENENKRNENLTIPRKSNRKKSPVNRYGNPVTHCIYVNYVNANVPNTLEEAINCNEYKKCQKAMDSEIKSLEKNDTWQIVDKPKDKKIIDVKWIYKRKSDNR